jgi:hypothetical protein
MTAAVDRSGPACDRPGQHHHELAQSLLGYGRVVSTN